MKEMRITDRVHEDGRHGAGLDPSILFHQLIEVDAVEGAFRFGESLDLDQVLSFASGIQSVAIEEHSEFQQGQLAQFFALRCVQLLVGPTPGLRQRKQKSDAMKPHELLETQTQSFGIMNDVNGKRP